ncbi:MAG: 2-phospho-L-lactate guanylyltransferase [Actinomycetes bacterium]
MSVSDPMVTLVVPVKALDRAKTRLAAVDARGRRELAAAFALDTVAAVLACPQVHRVLVVTGEPALVEPFHDIGAQVLCERALPGGLSAALTQGCNHVGVDPSGVLGILCADLPALRPDALTAALRAAADHTHRGTAPAAFIPDMTGIGTTVLIGGTGRALLPRFGPGSAHAHREQGAVPITADGWECLRQDVDTLADLHKALALGTGPRTTACVRSVLAEPPGAGPDNDPACTDRGLTRSVQA